MSFTAILLAALAAIPFDPTPLEQTFPQDTVELLSTEAGLPQLQSTGVRSVVSAEGVTAQSASGAHKAQGTAGGLFLNGKQVYPADANYSWAPRNVRALVFDAKDRLWFGCDNGAGMWDGQQWTLYTGKEGLPYTHFTCAAAAPDGSVWFGTERGAIRFDGQEWLYRAGKRFLADDHVVDIAVSPEGAVLIATKTGVSKITRTVRTLEEKAAEYERIVDERHRRLGQFVLRTYFKEPGNLETAYQRATDNDGLYTSMYGAAQCFRYAVTKDPKAKENALAALKAVKLLFDVTSIPGFPARAVIPTDSGEEDPNIHFSEAANLANQKEDPLWKNIVPRWPVSKDGKYWWKCDTSSDEVAGHYFFFAAFHDFVAESEEEKELVVDLAHAMTEHIVDNGFTLTDHDGKPTRWANWSPEYVNGKNGWFDRSLQSVEILSFLNVGLRLSGDKKFARAAKVLREEHDYHINAIRARSTWPPNSIVPWDNNLAFLSFYGLIAYEDDPTLKELYLTSLDNAWSFSSRQNDPFFNIVYLAFGQRIERYDQTLEEYTAEREEALAKAVETLVRAPQLLIGWRMENSHRHDVYLDPTPRRDRLYGWLANEDGDAVAIEERSHIRINSDHFHVDFGGEGEVEYEGTFFLLPYYMGLHYGLIE